MCKCTSGPPGHIETLQSNHINNPRFFVSVKIPIKDSAAILCLFKDERIGRSVSIRRVHQDFSTNVRDARRSLFNKFRWEIYYINIKKLGLLHTGHGRRDTQNH
jgi:hypothetical protein